jgi:signal transduction histidine kinase
VNTTLPLAKASASPTPRGEQIYQERTHALYVRTDRLFAGLFVLQWIAGIVAALVISPRTWIGPESQTHLHVWAAVVLGGLISAAPITLALLRPGHLSTRIVVSIAQACYSALLIHLSGGRIETHFHIFGSLAFLALYRDWVTLLPATLVVAADHLLRGVFWPESVFGVLTSSPWRALEHAGWVVFEDVFLVWGCVTSDREMREFANVQGEVEGVNALVERQVQQRTQELQQRTEQLTRSLENESRMESQLAQSQKLEAVGQLAAGVAHEINTPMQFINDNIHFLKECISGLFRVVDAYQSNLDGTGERKSWEERQALITETKTECRFDKIRVQIAPAIEESLEGIQRVVQILAAMKVFSHPGTTIKTSTDLNEAIRSTVTISKNRWKEAAKMVLELADDLPRVDVFPAEINQVLLNLVVNAGDAIVEKLGEGSGTLGQITIRTSATQADLVIEVSDTGGGIPAEIQQRIFDPFFTTKDVGKGTGQGLSISHEVIVGKHQGRIAIDSTPGVGSTFRIELPLEPAPTEPGTIVPGSVGNSAPPAAALLDA